MKLWCDWYTDISVYQVEIALVHKQIEGFCLEYFILSQREAKLEHWRDEEGTESRASWKA